MTQSMKDYVSSNNPHDEFNQMMIIRLHGDNDFVGIFRAFGLLMTESILLPTIHTVKKECIASYKKKIIEIFNAIAPYIYRMYWDQKLDCSIDIAEEHDLFYGDEEVYKKLETYDTWGNGDGIIIYSDRRIERI